MFCCVVIFFSIFEVALAGSDQEAFITAESAPPVKWNASVAAYVPLDDTIWDALSEGALVLIVFGLSSLLFRLFGLGQSKSAPRRPKHMKQTQKEADKAIDAATRPSKAARDALNSVHARTSDRSSGREHASAYSLLPNSGLENLMQMVRSGQTMNLPQQLDQLITDCSADEEMATHQLLSVLRACASSRCFNEALAAYQHVAHRIGAGEAAVWSVLLYCAVEAGRCKRGVEFFDKLCKLTLPSGHDFVNIVRCYVRCGDLQGLQRTLASLQGKKCSVDSFARNKALASCAAADGSPLDFAEAIAAYEPLDAIGYNTLMKLHAKAGRLPRILELRAEMASRGLEASDVTYGILLDACVGAGHFDRAKSIFAELRNSGVHLNVVHCTTFLKGLIVAGRLDEAHNVLDEMLKTPGAKPDLITYSTLVKAYATQGNVEASVSVLEKMMQQGIKPDDIIFNGVLSSCCEGPAKPTVTLNTFEVLLTHGLKPSTMSLSILLKALLLSNAWEEALETLEKYALRFNIEAETRLYVQIASACLKAHQGPVALKAYKAMLHATGLRGENLELVISRRLLRQCALNGDHDTALKIQEVAAQSGIAVELQPQSCQWRNGTSLSARRWR